MRKLFAFLCLLVQLSCLRAQQTYHQLEIIPSRTGTAGELRLIETNGWTAGTGTNYVGMKAPASISTNYVMEWPNALPGGAACLTINASGVISFDPTCAGAAFPVIDTTSIVEGSVDPTKELRFEVDGFTTGTVRVLTPQNADYTIAGTNIAQTFSATQTFQNVFVDAHLSRNIGATGTRFLNIFVGGFDASGQSFFQTGATLGGDVIPTLNNNWDIGSLTGGNIYASVNAVSVRAGKSATNGDVTIFNTTGSGSITSSASTDLVIDRNWRGDTNNLYTLGTASFRWARLYTEDLNVNGQVETSLIPETTNTITLGTTATEWLQINTHHVAAGRPTVTTGDVLFAHSAVATAGTMSGCSNSGTICINTNADFQPSTNNARDLGHASFLWNDIYSQRLNLGTASSITGSISLFNATNSATSTISVEDVGGGFADLTINTFLIPSTDACCGLGTSTKSWLSVSAYEYQDEFGNAGADATLTCGAGEAVKNITVSGGIVTSVSCGAP